MSSSRETAYDLAVQLFQAATMLAYRSGVSKFFLEGEIKELEEKYNITYSYKTKCTCPPDHPEIVTQECPVHWGEFQKNNCICAGGGRNPNCLFHGGNNCICRVKNGLRQPVPGMECPEHKYTTITVQWPWEKELRAFVEKLEREHPYPEERPE